VQGYNAQAATKERQIMIAAEVTIDSPDFGHLGPMVAASERELRAAGVTETPGVVVADAGYWHHAQMQDIVNRGIPVLVPPDAGHTKFNRRIDRFQRRGRSAARSEWRLITATHNLLKLHSHQIAAAAA
jgi:hypothetical protein